MKHASLQCPLPPILDKAKEQFASLRHERSVPILDTSTSRQRTHRLWLAAPVAAALVLTLVLLLPGRHGATSGSFGDRPQPDPYSALQRGADQLSRWGQGFGTAVAEQSATGEDLPKRTMGLSLPPRPRSSGGFAPLEDELS